MRSLLLLRVIPSWVILVLAGCALAPLKPDVAACRGAGACPACPQCPPPKPAPETARYEEGSFDALPGWSGAALQPSLRAFLAGCARPAALGGLAGPLGRACEPARAVPENDEVEARRFFESAFTADALISSERGDPRLITGDY